MLFFAKSVLEITHILILQRGRTAYFQGPITPTRRHFEIGKQVEIASLDIKQTEKYTKPSPPKGGGEGGSIGS